MSKKFLSLLTAPMFLSFLASSEARVDECRFLANETKCEAQKDCQWFRNTICSCRGFTMMDCPVGPPDYRCQLERADYCDNKI